MLSDGYDASLTGFYPRSDEAHSRGQSPATVMTSRREVWER